MPSYDPKLPRKAWNAIDGHPDHAARQAMLRRSQANRSLADPEASLIEIREILSDSIACSARPDRVKKAIEACEYAIQLVMHPNVPRGHHSVGMLLKLLCNLCASGVVSVPRSASEWSNDAQLQGDRRQRVNGHAGQKPLIDKGNNQANHSQNRSHRR